MSRAGCNDGRVDACAGFTLFEMLVVMVVLALATAAVATVYTPSGGVQVKAAALLTASRLRDLRSSAMQTRSERVATVDIGQRIIRFDDGRAALDLGRSIDIAVTSADSERGSSKTAGVRFFANGSSTGGTIDLRSGRQAYEVRINWLTGRVSTSAIN